MIDLEIDKKNYLLQRKELYNNLYKNDKVKILENNSKIDVLLKVFVCDDKQSIDFFINNCILYYLDNIYDIYKSFIGLDFEFNNGKIALSQIGLYYETYYNIYIIDPKLLTDKQMDIYIKTILISPIHRITHGSDSLDVPYIFEQIFNKDIDKIIKFTNEMIDTRYLCEYHKIVINYPDKKCSIYDALLYYGTIDINIYNYLNKIMSNIHYNRTDEWNIYKLSENHLQYTAYDVIFLKDFLNDIIASGNKSLEFIPSITRFIYYIKWKIYDYFSTPNEECTYNDIIKINNNSNNNFIIFKRKKITLLDIYNKYIKTCYLKEDDIYINNLLKIDYFKTILNNIFKYIVYGILLKKYKVSVSIDIETENKFFIENLLIGIDKLKLKKISKLFYNFYNLAKKIDLRDIK